MNSVITSVEEGLGLPSPSELAQEEEESEEIKHLAEGKEMDCISSHTHTARVYSLSL